MAETGASVITSALQEILVQASEAPLEPDETQDAISYLNRMMTALAVTGITLGYTVIDSLGDDITVADGAIEGIVKNLAVRLHPQFATPGTPINPLLVQQARDGLDVMRVIAIDSIGPGLFPDTLPIGSGNEDNNFGGIDHFFTDPEEPILTEEGGFISVESGTELP